MDLGSRSHVGAAIWSPSGWANAIVRPAPTPRSPSRHGNCTRRAATSIKAVANETIHAQLGAEIDHACERALAKLPLDQTLVPDPPPGSCNLLRMRHSSGTATTSSSVGREVGNHGASRTPGPASGSATRAPTRSSDACCCLRRRHSSSFALRLSSCGPHPPTHRAARRRVGYRRTGRCGPETRSG